MVVADDASLTPFGGMAVSGEVIRRLELVEAIDRACRQATADGARAVKVRARGASTGQLLVSLAESLLAGGDAVQDLERLREDRAGAELRAVAEVPAASTVAQLARRVGRTHLAAAERAVAWRLNAFDRQLGRDAFRPVTLDFDSTQVEVYGRHKPGARVTHQGRLCYQPQVATWAERGRVLGSELLAGPDSTRGEETLALLSHALECLPDRHGPVSARFDSGFYAVGLLEECRRQDVRFSVSAPRSSAMWSALDGIADDAWQPAEGFEHAEVAETAYTPEGWRRVSAEPLRLLVRRVSHRPQEIGQDPRARRRSTLHPDQRQLVLDDAQAAADELVYAYSFILTDHDPDRLSTVAAELHHRRRAQIEERIKDHKLGVSLRRLPLSDQNANRVWLFATALALNLLGALSDLMFGADPPQGLPRRRQAKLLRRMLLCVPARVLHHARQTILRLPAGLGSAVAFGRAYTAARGLAPPVLV